MTHCQNTPNVKVKRILITHTHKYSSMHIYHEINSLFKYIPQRTFGLKKKYVFNIIVCEILNNILRCKNVSRYECTDKDKACLRIVMLFFSNKLIYI